MQPARYLNLGFPICLCSWVIGLLILKLVIANLGTMFGFGLSGVDSVGSFILGRSLGELLGLLLRLALIVSLTWLALRRIVGRDSGLARGTERLTYLTLRTLLRCAIWLGRCFVQWVTDRRTNRRNRGPS